MSVRYLRDTNKIENQVALACNALIRYARMVSRIIELSLRTLLCPLVGACGEPPERAAIATWILRTGTVAVLLLF